jgi:hypothetical protein
VDKKSKILNEATLNELAKELQDLKDAGDPVTLHPTTATFIGTEECPFSDYSVGATVTTWSTYTGIQLNLAQEAALFHALVLTQPGDSHRDIAVNYLGVEKEYTIQEFLTRLGFLSPTLGIPDA